MLARELSYTSAGVTLALGVEHGVVVRYNLFDRGADVDEYLSVPEYYGALPPGDNVVDAQGIKVYIDQNSFPYLSGSEIDFVDNSMMGAGFAIKNPNVKSSCGCGQSHRF